MPARRRSPVAVTAVVVGIVIVLAIAVANVWTEWQWYGQVGYTEVWRTQWVARLVTFLVFGLIAGGALWLTLWIARRVRPELGGRPALDRYREQVRPLERAVMWIAPVFVGVIAGAVMSSRWREILAWLNSTSFGVKDPQFGLDASFYVFTLPVLHALVGFYLTILILCTALAAFVHLLYGGISGGGRNFVASKGARIQLAVMGALIMLGVAANYWLQRYSLLNKVGEKFYGASFTDINAVLPSRGILVGISIIVAGVFLLVIWRADWRIPAVGVGLLLVAAIAIGGIYPAVIQRFTVTPNVLEKETPFIKRNIDATRYAYGLDKVEVTDYRATTEADADALRADADTTTQIRLLDPNVVAPAFQQLQQNKQYYNFGDTLQVDRYRVGDEIRDTVIAVRELNLDGLSDANRNWVNDTTVFTHGFGVVAAYGNRVKLDGQPTFWEGGIPSAGDMGDYEPRVYFGQNLPLYSIVGAPAGTTPWELDYPDDNSETGQVNSTFTGDGGPSVGNIFAKLMYAIRFGEEQILLSDRVTSESQVLYYRDPQERVQKIAPYLELDQTTYPAVVDGRVVWVVDGYTTTSQFPYSAAVTPTGVFYGNADATASGMSPSPINYIRNSVKATVDAYDGTVNLYAWDTEDPILQTWEKVFPASYKPISEISGALMSHLRYPEDLFTAQRFQLQSYHVTDPATFFNGSDSWNIPNDPTKETQKQPPYYLSLQMPDQEAPSFSLTGTFIQGGENPRNILTGYLAVDSETGDTPGEVADGYGTLRLLELPRDTTIPGPGQVQNNFSTDTDAQTTLNLLRQGDSTVINGNLLTVPVGGGLLYVQPVYVEAKAGTKVPLLRKVFVAFGDEVGFADTLQGALDQVFGAGAAEEPEEPGTEEPGTEEPTEPTDPDTQAAQQALNSALTRAQQAIEAGQDALAVGDFAAYGQAQEDLANALEDAVAASRRLEGNTDAEPTASPDA
ncbi:UPF0182 family protein [Demequina sp.]|uniref:UPF0182 family membrane protein n=1 Tax=Demequina sp. TaxID=2050685 RepID=UPI003D118E67